MNQTRNRIRSIVMIALAIAIITISSWVTIPLGPIPFTLQMFSIPLIIFVLRPFDAIASVYLYEIIGAIGLPVFSGMRGGIGVLLGPTGGFLMGCLIGVPLAALLLYWVRSHSNREEKPKAPSKSREPQSLIALVKQSGWELLASLIFIFFAYLVGCIWYAYMASVDMTIAFATCAAPFIVPDIIKSVCAIAVAQPIRAAQGRRYW